MRILLVLLLGTQAAVCSTVARPPMLRLSRDISPVQYKASLVITPGKRDFSGELAIQLIVNRSTDQIWLDSEELTIRAAVITAGGRTRKPRVIETVKGFAGFLLDERLVPGVATLTLRYRGIVSDKPGPGLSFSTRGNSNYVVTDFEPTAARRVFPCFDEPNFKVPWQLTIDAPAKDTVISNTALQSDTVQGQRHVVSFHRTKPLPSYLIAFTIGDYEAIPAGKVGRNRVPLRIIVPRGDRAKASFAMRIAPAIIERLENYFDIPYPYEKLDQVAVPNYPEGSAMEDAGSILYDDSLILCAPGSLTHETEERILSVMIHETTHQWFGDLVTLAWWNDTWLNEGFTEWMEWKIRKGLGQEWRDDQSAIDDLGRLVRQDILPSAHPIRQRIQDPGQIETELDDITYFKTAEVLTMIEHYVGKEKLQTSIRRYLRNHLFGNATSQDFLHELANVNPGAATSFEQFLNRISLPELDVALDCSATGAIVNLRQQTFRPLGAAQEGPSPWTFPVCIRYAAGQKIENSCTLMHESASEIHLNGHGCPAWLLANADASGYYITKYDRQTFVKLTKSLHTQSLLDQLHFVWQDGLLLRSGKETPARMRDTINALGPNYTIPHLLALTISASPLLRYETSANERQLLTDYFEQTLGPVGRKLGWVPSAGASPKEREDQFEAVSSIALLAEDPKLIETARNLVADWLRDRNSVSPDVVGPALIVTGRFADENQYNQLLASAKAEKDHENRLRTLRALAVVRDPILLQRSLNLLTSGAFPLDDSLVLLLGAPIYHLHALPETLRLPVKFIKDHPVELRSRFPKPLGRDYSYVLAYSASAMCSESDRQLAFSALSPILSPEEGGQQRLKEVLDSIHLCSVAREATAVDFQNAFGGRSK